MASPKSTSFVDHPTVPNVDSTGREQVVPAAQRIDLGGPEAYKAMAFAAGRDLVRSFPKQQLTWAPGRYGRRTVGNCLGEVEASYVTHRDPAGIVTCSRSGTLLTMLPYGKGLYLAVSDRAAVRPDVIAYVEASLGHARTAVATAHVAPLDAREIAHSRAKFRAFVADAKRRGMQPVIG